MSYQVTVHTSMHPEYPPGKVIEVEFLEECLHNSRFQWADVKLSNGVTRSLLVTTLSADRVAVSSMENVTI
jgi:hypothetical protein